MLRFAMIFSGVDLVEVARIGALIARWQERFLHRVYTEAELELCRGQVTSLAARFAAKEAVMKLLGTGRSGVSWKDIEILTEETGKPMVRLSGRAERKASELRLQEVSISMSHTQEHAIALAIGQN